MIYLLYLFILFAGILCYFRIADSYNIIDKPNERSSHTEVTIRGGGVIFLISAAIVWLLYPDYWKIVSGLFIIGAVSFVDDRITLSNKIRLFFHLVAVSLLFDSLEFFKIPVYILILLYIFVIGIINVYNFMDGINGITGLYSLTVLSGLQYINCLVIPFVQKELIWLPLLSCIVFLFFNFRKKARCFAGDVGSITIAFWIIFLLLKLMLLSGNFNYILYLLIYGLDSVTTIMFRILRKENILQAHRSHFYQYLANEKKIPHLYVATIYALLQLFIIILLIKFDPTSLRSLIIIGVVSSLSFIALRFGIEGRGHLLKNITLTSNKIQNDA